MCNVSSGLQHNSRRPHYNFISQHSYRQPFQTNSHPKITDKPLPTPLSTGSNPDPFPTGSKALPKAHQASSHPGSDPLLPTGATTTGTTPVTNHQNGTNTAPVQKSSPQKAPPPAGNKDTHPGRDENNFNWTPGCIGAGYNSVPVQNGLANRNWTTGTRYNILSGKAEGNGANRTSNGGCASSGGVEKAPFLNMRAGGIRPNNLWRMGAGCTHPAPTSDRFRGPSALSRGSGTTAALGYSRHGTSGGPGSGRGNSNILRNDDVHLNEEKQ